MVPPLPPCEELELKLFRKEMTVVKKGIEDFQVFFAMEFSKPNFTSN